MNFLVEFPAAAETALDLRCLLYRGGAATRVHNVERQIEAGVLGQLILSRIPLVSALRRELSAQCVEGIAVATLKTRWNNFRQFVAFVDADIGVLDEASVISNFRNWVAHLNRRVHADEISVRTVYSDTTRTAALLAGTLGVPLTEVTYGARMKKPKGFKNASKWSKQNLGEVHEFIDDLRDVIRSLNLNALRQQLPVSIELTSTGLNYPQWSGMRPSQLGKSIKATASPNAQRRHNARKTIEARDAKAKDESLGTRFPLLNLRASAEFMLFVANTGMNRAQATKLTLDSFRFQSFEDRTLIKVYKGRRGGEVEFSINAGYRPYFEQYLLFRHQAYPEGVSDRLFLTIANTLKVSDGKFNTENLFKFLKSIGRPWIASQGLRNVKGSVLARSAGVTEAARSLQNSEEVFNRHYAEPPSHQVAATELTAFWKIVSKDIAQAVGPGVCLAAEKPLSSNAKRDAQPEPDCINPAGCLFCAFNRGIDSLDYVWNLLSYRILKSIEISRYKLPLAGDGENAAHTTLVRINQIVAEIKREGPKQTAWVDDVEGRMISGNFHPHWEKWIAMAGIY